MTDNYDNFQLDPNAIGSDWKFTGRPGAGHTAPGTRVSNYEWYKAGDKFTFDRTRTVFAYEYEENPERVIGDGFLGHGIDWSLFNYNPYGKLAGENPNFRVLNDYLQITGLGGIDVETEDVMDKKVVGASGMVAYYNYPTEGYNSFGKKGDKRWVWQGNSWIPAV